MANNLRYLLEHFCLDGQKIDISSQLDEDNANNIEKINTQTIPSINARIDDIKNTDIPNINSRIDSIKNTDIPSINQKINTINNATIPSVQESVTAVDEKADRINESVAKNTRDIGNLTDNVTMQGNAINSINTEKIPKIEKDTNDVKKSMANLRVWTGNEITEVKNQQTDDETKINDNTTDIENLTTHVNELTTKVGTNTDSINELTTKVNTNTDSINTINNTSIPHLQSEIDSLSGGGTGSVGELREKVEKNTSDISTLSGKVDTNTADISTLSEKVETNTSAISELNRKVTSNTSDISTLRGKVDTNTSNISDIKNGRWTKIIDQSSKGIHVELYQAPNLPLMELYATLIFPQNIPGGLPIEIRIANGKQYAPYHLAIAPVDIPNHYDVTGYLYAKEDKNDLIVGFNMNEYGIEDLGTSTILYRYQKEH